MNRKLRLTAASVAAAVALGVAAPTAQAATEHAPARAAATQTITVDSNAEARTLSASLTHDGIAAKTIGQTSSVTVQSDLTTKGVPWRQVIRAYKLLKRVPGAVSWSAKVAKEAVKLGKAKGVAYLKKKIGELHFWNPVKWVWKTILVFANNADTLWSIIQYIVHHH
ncbi:hypothetical protein [Streptomyces natalensis]|uniref:Secreted protein n=1 Tax=Streptomyces natalensis ATCC 27448 TaxID=1240678 RepID=A0A0D7CP55_9ACTN|nr:hypothetical protein [Streptomyces natalensis]KIZ18034.1 hypothetical protein SNA_10165 [Streptomyces natalensis ATCC 27448]